MEQQSQEMTLKKETGVLLLNKWEMLHSIALLLEIRRVH